MQNINYHNHRIAYDLKGKGTTIVFLHGFGETRKMWSDYLPFFKEYQTLTIDLPGAGASDIMDVSITRMAKIVNSVLLKENIEKCVFIGHSMGGYVACAFAKLYEEKLLGFCLFHSQPYADSKEKKAGRNKAINFVKKNGSGVYFKGLLPMLFANDFIKNNKNTLEKIVSDASAMESSAVIYQMQAMRNRPDNQSVLVNAKVPVCFIIGKEDIAVPAANSLNQTFLPKISDIHILQNVGHMGMYEATQKTVKIIKDFIRFCN